MKKGLDYFPLSCYMDDSVKLIEAEFGLKGFAVIIKIWQSIYMDEGYYKPFGEDVLMLFAREILMDKTELEKIIKSAIKREIFDEILYKKYKILTSKGVQERFVKCTERRKKIKMIKEYLLLKEDDIKNIELSDLNENVCILEKNDNIFKQSKVKESKVNKSKVKESGKCPAEKEKKLLFGEYKNVSLTKKEYDSLKRELGEKMLLRYIKKADEYVRLSGKTYKDFALLIKKWEEEDRGKKKKGFCNYNDTGGADYSALAEELKLC